MSDIKHRRPHARPHRGERGQARRIVPASRPKSPTSSPKAAITMTSSSHCSPTCLSITDPATADDDGGQLVVNSDWCSMIYPRLLLARDLLASDGVIFISIDENESANLKKICDEVFGNECFVNKVIWRSSDNSNNDAKQFSNDYNDILIYSKKPGWQPNRLQDPEKRRHFKNPDNDPRGAWFDGDPLNSPNYRENLRYEIVAPNGNIIKPPANGWRWSKETLDQKMKSGEIYFNEKQTNIKRRTYLQDNPEQFIAKVSRLIIEQKAAMIVDHISYDRIQGEYDSTIFANAGGRDETDAIRVSKCVQDWVFPDGDPKKGVEAQFTRGLEAASEVAIYAKLPRGFQIPTPVGNYAPDWAVAFREDSGLKHIFFIAETKGTMSSLNCAALRTAKSDARSVFLTNCNLPVMSITNKLTPTRNLWNG